MTEKGIRALQAASALRTAVERVADGLATSCLEDVLAGEAGLATALSAVPDFTGLAPMERAAVQDEFAHARRALLRCRRLGAALADFVRISLEAHGHEQGYGSQVGAARRLASALNARG